MRGEACPGAEGGQEGGSRSAPRDLGLYQQPCVRGCGLGFEVWGLRFGVWSSGFGVQGLGSGIWGLGFEVWGSGFEV